MGNMGRADLLGMNNGKRKGSAATETRMAVLKDFYSALDSVLFLIETSDGSRRDLAQGIDFYDEVRDFEISLIRQALRLARGSQVRAAALLRLNPTTLNAKIKNYSIDRMEQPRIKGFARSLRIANE